MNISGIAASAARLMLDSGKTQVSSAAKTSSDDLTTDSLLANAAGTGKPAQNLADAVAAFKKEAEMTPAERARRDVMKSMHLTEDDLKAMPPEQRKLVDKQIQDAVAKRLQMARKDDDTQAPAIGSVTDQLA